MSEILPLDLSEFLDSQKDAQAPKSKFFFEEKFELYVRAGQYSTGFKVQKCITVARIEVFQQFQRQGVLKSLIATLSWYAGKYDYHAIVFECVHNPILFNYLLNRNDFVQCPVPLDLNFVLQFRK